MARRRAGWWRLGVGCVVMLFSAVVGCTAPRAAGQAPGSPRPIAPASGAVLPQDNLLEECTVFGARWTFEWEPTPDARRYQVLIEHDGQALATYSQVFVQAPPARIGRCGCFDETLLTNWNWKVRAQAQNGEWGTWSSPRPFSIAPFSGCMHLHVEH